MADETVHLHRQASTGHRSSSRWVVFEVADAEVVTPLENQPVVLSDADDHIDGWVYAEDSAEPVELAEGQTRHRPRRPGPAVRWYHDPTRWDVLLATSGPDDWQRIALDDAADVPVDGRPRRRGHRRGAWAPTAISFEVDQTGVRRCW